jgi:hypothetical protein
MVVGRGAACLCWCVASQCKAKANVRQLCETGSRTRGVNEGTVECCDISARAPPILPRVKTTDVSKNVTAECCYREGCDSSTHALFQSSRNC